KLFVFFCLLPSAYCLLFSVVCAHCRLNVSAHIEIAFNLYAQRIARVHKIFEDQVDDMLVKNFYVAKRIDVELQTLQLDSTFVRRVLDPNRGKVGEVGERADAGELGYLEIDFDFFSGKLVRKSVEWVKAHLFARCRANVQALLIRWR